MINNDLVLNVNAIIAGDIKIDNHWILSHDNIQYIYNFYCLELIPVYQYSDRVSADSSTTIDHIG